ncbi:MAG TPA: MmcB family DNA repair protein [Kiloniellales bacterium]|nr:MmcB family DNA repair protein [Kiloniellales bacterium]
MSDRLEAKDLSIAAREGDTCHRPEESASETAEGRERAQLLCRGVCRLLEELGYVSLTEFTLASGRRVDVMALGRDGQLLAIEVKSCLADFRADSKWPEYREWCEGLYFAVPPEFPQDVLPHDCGLMVADPWGAEILRSPARRPLAPARRKALTLRFARAAGQRLGRLLDPRGREAL